MALRRKCAAPEPDPVQPALDLLGDVLETATSRLAAALRSQQRPDGLPRLRLLHNAVAAAPGASKTMVNATDALVDSANTAAGTLRAGLAG